ncbi:MAG: segregation/condensation protein A [Planctomycetes bacterium]|nr:segregation/condensation protein A [Planctomycetota bacterium]
MTYRVELPVFCGPLDLLLHLVKQQEVDIHEIRIASILDQYLAYLEVLEALDLTDLGDFLVLASTLMEIKSREMLPREEVDLDDEFDPKDDLIRRLLEYKRFRDVSRRLERFAARRARMFDVAIPLPDEVDRAHREQEEDEELLDLGDIEIWTLTAAFARLMAETGQQAASMSIGVDRRNVAYYAELLLQKVRDGQEREFVSLFEREGGRYGLIGTFIAILEMMKQGVLRAHQREQHGDILVVFVGDPTLTAERILSGGERLDADDHEPAPSVERRAPVVLPRPPAAAARGGAAAQGAEAGAEAGAD